MGEQERSGRGPHEQVAELRELPQPELVQRHDELVRGLNADLERVMVSYRDARRERLRRIDAYRDELSRRESVRQGERMEALTRSLNRLTWWIVGLTVLIAIATVVGVVLTAWSPLPGS